MRRFILAFLAVSVSSCSSTEKTAYAVAGAVLFGAQAPANEIEQIYYLGVFDPIEQLPETIYRIRVKGQASLLSTTRFASGWVPASLIDSLSSNVSFKSKNGAQIALETATPDMQSLLPAGRRLVMFGPEGFREAPSNHRLVVVMGSDPDAFFEGMDSAIGAIGQANQESRDHELTDFLLEAHYALRLDLARIDDASKKLASQLPTKIAQ